MSDAYQLQTPENVRVRYDLAGVGSRFLAAAVDTGIQVILLTLLALALVVAGVWAGAAAVFRDIDRAESSSAAIWLVALLVLANFLLLWGYYVAFELLWNGQTPGKRLFRLRVLRDNGYPVGFLESLIRNLVRVIDFLPSFYGVGVVAMLVDGRSRRLGDLAAGTIVVKERRDLQVAELLPEALSVDAIPPASQLPNLDRLTRRDYQLLREYLLRRERLAESARDTIAWELSRVLAERLEIATPERHTADGFLLEVAAAYRTRIAVFAPGARSEAHPGVAEPIGAATVRSRPPAFAAYSARSAAVSNSPGSEDVVAGALATPALTESCPRPPAAQRIAIA
jgi:uncharacterized RDD family membrane protein YckC